MNAITNVTIVIRAENVLQEQHLNLSQQLNTDLDSILTEILNNR